MTPRTRALSAVSGKMAEGLIKAASDESIDPVELMNAISTKVRNIVADNKARNDYESMTDSEYIQRQRPSMHMFDIPMQGLFDPYTYLASQQMNSVQPMFVKKDDCRMYGVFDMDKKGIPDLDDLVNLSVFKNPEFYKGAAPEVDKLMFNIAKGVTTVIWKDKTVTVVKCPENQVFNKELAFEAALAKKIYGTTSMVNRLADKLAYLSSYSHLVDALASNIYGKNVADIVAAGTEIKSKAKKEKNLNTICEMEAVDDDYSEELNVDCCEAAPSDAEAEWQDPEF